MEKLVTVFLPSYNYGQYLERAIKSVVSQEYPNYEFLISDDASTDNSPEIIRAYADKYPQIKPTFLKENRGLLPNTTEGISKAQGDYICFLSADDHHLPGFLQKNMDVLLKHPQLGLCCSDFGHLHLEDQHNVRTAKLIKGVTETQIFLPETIIHTFQTTTFVIPGHTSVIRKDLVQKYGGFDPKLMHFSDWYLLHAIALNHGAAYIPETLAAMLLHEENYAKKTSKKTVYRNLLKKLQEPQNKKICKQFRRSTLLACIFRELFWPLLLSPRYLLYWPYIGKKYSIKGRVLRSIKKRMGLHVAKG